MELRNLKNLFQEARDLIHDHMYKSVWACPNHEFLFDEGVKFNDRLGQEIVLNRLFVENKCLNVDYLFNGSRSISKISVFSPDDCFEIIKFMYDNKRQQPVK